MATITLAGDSIRLGYDSEVDAALPGHAISYSVGGSLDSSELLVNIAAHVTGFGSNIVHINSGLHDVLRTPLPISPCATSLVSFESNWRAILNAIIMANKNVRIIICLTTPVDETSMPPGGFRYNADINSYNAILEKVARDYSYVVAISDLRGFVIGNGTQDNPDIPWSDGTHFVGYYDLLGGYVAGIISLFLDKAGDPVMANKVFFGCCLNCPADFKTGAPNLTIIDGIAEFTSPQIDDLMGIGAQVTYDGATLGFISGKISTSIWKITTGRGNNPVNVVGALVNSITHPFASLSLGVANCIGVNYLNSTNLITANVDCYLCHYFYDTADTTAIIISGTTTDATHRIICYTSWQPSEGNKIQRNITGIGWDATRPSVQLDTTSVIQISNETQFIIIEGLQIWNTNTVTNARRAIRNLANASSTIVIRKNIIRMSNGNNVTRYGISIDVAGGSHEIYNNILYTSGAGYGTNIAVHAILFIAAATAKIYENTMYQWYQTLNNVVGATTDSKNNIILKNATINAGITQDYDIYDRNEGEAHGTLTGQPYGDIFVAVIGDADTWDFNLNKISQALNLGIPLGATYSSDLSNDTGRRPQGIGWDRGAFELSDKVRWYKY